MDMMDVMDTDGLKYGVQYGALRYSTVVNCNKENGGGTGDW
jgi:hypothetical protein